MKWKVDDVFFGYSKDGGSYTVRYLKLEFKKRCGLRIEICYQRHKESF